MSTKRIACAAMLATLLTQSPLFASEKYFRVGDDSTGNPYFLDTTTMGKVEKGFGNVIRVYQSHSSSSMTEILLRASCGDERLWIVGLRTYSNGIKIEESKGREEISARGTSPGANAMLYYCQSIGARGW